MTGNSILKISTFWNCECNTSNPLRYRKCRACGKDIPVRIKEAIYEEELQLQKRNFAEELRRKRMLRYQKQQEVLKSKQLLLVVLLVAALGASAARWAMEGMRLDTIKERGEEVAIKLRLPKFTREGAEAGGEYVYTLAERLGNVIGRVSEIEESHDPVVYLEYTLEEFAEIAEKFRYLEERMEELSEKEVRMRNVFYRYYQ